MATKPKAKVNEDEKLQNQDFDLFEALRALDGKDYAWFDKLTEDQKKKFVPYMMVHWMSASGGGPDLQRYYVSGTDYFANKHLFNEQIQKHPELQWLMLCASSPGVGKQYHKWIPHLSQKIANFKEPAKLKEVKDYFSKIYAGVSAQDIAELSQAYVDEQNKKHYLASTFPSMKLADIETLSKLITDDNISSYERDRGN